MQAAAPSADRCGSSPFSHRLDPSVRSPSRIDDACVVGPSKLAHSISTVVVSAVTSLHSEPIRPATAEGFSASAITSVSVSSSAVLAVERRHRARPSVARRTMISRPATLSRSKACVGSPIASMT